MFELWSLLLPAGVTTISYWLVWHLSFLICKIGTLEFMIPKFHLCLKYMICCLVYRSCIIESHFPDIGKTDIKERYGTYLFPIPLWKTTSGNQLTGPRTCHFSLLQSVKGEWACYEPFRQIFNSVVRFLAYGEIYIY